MTRKNVLQNLRNKRINKRYITTLKILFKLFLFKIKNCTKSNDIKRIPEITLLISNLFSIIDKAIKKQVIHKNKGNRKKIQIIKLFKNIL